VDSEPFPWPSSPSPLFPTTLPVVANILEQGEEGRAWLAKLPSAVEQLRELWQLRLGAPIHGGSCSWVAPVWLPDGASAILKVAWPHREAAGEAEALKIWDGRGAVKVLRDDPSRCALLIERCEPGDPLSEAHGLSVAERLHIAAEILAQLWSAQVPERTGLEHVGAYTAALADVAEERMDRLRPGFDPGLVALGARLLRELPSTAERKVVVHGDINPGNILRARREPWLAIDAKSMVGDPCYDPWPLLSQIDDPFVLPEPLPVLAERFGLISEVVGESVQRLAAWAMARELDWALWSVEHAASPIAFGSIDKVRAFAQLAEL